MAERNSKMNISALSRLLTEVRGSATLPFNECATVLSACRGLDHIGRVMSGWGRAGMFILRCGEPRGDLQVAVKGSDS